MTPALARHLPGRPRPAQGARRDGFRRRLRAGPRAAPPGRRDLRAVPRPLRAAPAGPRARRHPAVGRVGAVRPAAVPAPRGGRDARRLRHGPGHRIVPQRPVPGLQVVGRACRPSCSPSSRSPRPRSRRSASSSGRWSSSRPTTPSRPRPGGSATDPAVEKILVCTPDKDMAQLVVDERIVLWDRRRDLTYDDAGVRAKWGVAPTSIPDWLAVVGDSSDGYPGIPGWGAKSAAAVLAATAISMTSRRAPRPGRCPASAARGPRRWPRACATTGTRRCSTATSPGCAPPTMASRSARRSPMSSAGTARPRAEWEAFCEEWGLAAAARPHRWLAD